MRARNPVDAILPGVPAALPSDHDDHHGGAAGRRSAGARDRRGLGTAAPARHHDRRRADLQPDADALHDAGDLSVLRPAGHPPLAQASRYARGFGSRVFSRRSRLRSQVRRNSHEYLGTIHPPAHRNHAADSGCGTGGRRGVPAACPFRRCRRWTSPPSRCRRRCRAQVRRPWHRRWPRRSSGSSDTLRRSPR